MKPSPRLILHPAELEARVFEAARRRAHELRDEAIDDLWNDTAAAASRTLRSARRLAASLSRHQRRRAIFMEV